MDSPRAVKAQIPELKRPSTCYEEFSPSSSIFAHSLHLVGFEFDGTACFRKGTVEGPDAIREDSPGIEAYSPYLDRDLEDYANLYDLGNLNVGEGPDVDENWEQGTQQFFELVENLDIETEKVRFLTLGGEHSISYAPIVSYLKKFSDLALLHLDAHADLRDGYEGHYYSHASVIRRATDHFGDQHKLIQYGIRSGTREEYQWMKERKTQRTSLESFLESVSELDDSRPIYLTLDLDYFDPCYVPGTGTPEPGGETFHSFIKLVKILKRKNFVGADVVELSPRLDQSGNSSVFATKVVRELVLLLAHMDKGQSDVR